MRPQDVCGDGVAGNADHDTIQALVPYERRAPEELSIAGRVHLSSTAHPLQPAVGAENADGLHPCVRAAILEALSDRST